MYSICLTSTSEYNSATLLEKYIAGVANGDTEALRALYEQTKIAVYGYALSVLKNRQDAEDVLQDTYIRIHAAASGYQPAGKPMAWIITIAKNTALMRLREAKKTTELPEDSGWAQTAPPSSDRIVLEKALQCLNEREREILMLHAVGGFKHREIAALMDMTLSTVLSVYHRARKKLKANLAEGE